MSGAGAPVTAEDIAGRGVQRRQRVIGATAADILLGTRQQNRVTRGQRRDAQGGAARTGTAAWLGMFNRPTRLRFGPQRGALNRGLAARIGIPSMPVRIAGFQRAIRTLVPPIVRGDAGDTGSRGNTGSSGGSDDDQLANMMADLDV